MIAPLVEHYPDLVKRAFDDIITRHKALSRDWLHSLITAVHKTRKAPKTTQTTTGVYL